LNYYASAVQGLALERSLRSERSGETERTEDERSEAERRQANRSEWRNKASTDKHDALASVFLTCGRVSMGDRLTAAWADLFRPL